MSDDRDENMPGAWKSLDVNRRRSHTDGDLLTVFEVFLSSPKSLLDPAIITVRAALAPSITHSALNSLLRCERITSVENDRRTLYRLR